MTIRFAVKTDVGRVREGNEDSYVLHEPLFGVADGMGGHLAGDVASRIAVDVITDEIDGDRGDRESLVRAVKNANSAILEKSQTDASLSGMGTTCTLVFVDGNEARIAHVGDSRAYLLRDGKLSQLTDDHTLVNRMVKEGRLRAEDAERHPQRSVITRALGIDPNVRVDYRTIELRPRDRLLVCSDGLNSMVDGAAIQQALEETSDPEEAADRLVQIANDAGGEDNITVVVIDYVDPGNPSATTAAPGRATREPVKIDSAPPPGSHPVSAIPPPRRWPRRLAAWVVAVAVVAVAGYFTLDYFLGKAWFVGSNESGVVAIYQGIPEEVAGFDLKDEITATGIALGDLPEFLREDVAEGIKVDSEDAARSKVEDLRLRAREFREAGERESGERDRRKKSRK